MTQTESLVAKLGLEKGDFSRGLASSIEETKQFGSLWRGMSKLFGLAGFLMAIIGYFREVIQHARESKDILDENVMAVRRFGDAFAQAKNQQVEWGVEFLGFFNRLGEKFALAAMWLFSMDQNAAKLMSRWRSSSDADLAIAKLAEEEQKYGAEFRAITERLKTLNEQIRDAKLGQLAPSERLQAILNREVDLINEKVHGEDSAIARRRMEEKLAANHLEMVKATADIQKQADAAIEKTLDAQCKLDERKRQLAFDKLGLEQQILAVQLELQRCDQAIDVQKKQGLDVTDAESHKLDLQEQLKKLIGDQTELQATKEKEIAAAQAAEVAELERIQDAHKALAAETGQIMANWKGIEKSVTFMLNARNGRTLNQASDAALQELVRQDKQRLADVEQASHTRPFGPSIADSFARADIQQEIKNANDQLELRRKLRGDVGRLGVEGARRYYDPLNFDRLVEQYVKVATGVEKTNSLLTEVNDRLRPVLPRA